MADDVAKLGIQVDTKDSSQKVKQLSTDLDGLKKSAQGAAAPIDALESSTKKASTSLKETSTAAAAVVAPIGAIEAAAKRAGISYQEMAARAGAAAVANDAVTASAVAATAATANLSGIIGVVGLGIGALAVAGGIAALALAKIGDEAERTRLRLVGITGSAKAGTQIFNDLQGITKKTGIEFDTLAGAMETAVRGQNKFSGIKQVWVNASDGPSQFTKFVEKAFEGIGNFVQRAGGDAKEAQTIFSVLGNSIKETGGLTGAAFEKIIQTSPLVARALALAFGFKDLEAFEARLDRAPASILEINNAIARLDPSKIDALAKQSDFLGQEFRKITEEWKNFLTELSKDGAFTFVASALKAISDQVHVEIEALAEMKRDFIALGTTISTFVSGVIADFGKLVSIVISTAQTVASAVAAIANAAKGSSFGGQGFTDPMSGLGSPSAPPDSSGNDLPAFAGGGSFTVGGSGATDSQLVQFMATPGEQVTVSNSAQSLPASISASSGNNASLENAIKATAKATSNGGAITNALGRTSADITAAIDQLKAAIAAASAAQVSATKVSAARIAGTMAAIPLGGLGNGGVDMKSLDQAIKQLNDDRAFNAQFSNSDTPWQNGTFVSRGGGSRGGGSSGGGGVQGQVGANFRYSQPGSGAGGSYNGDFGVQNDSGGGFSFQNDSGGGGFSNYTSPENANPYYGPLDYYNPYYGDPGSMDYGGGSADFGYFASGGSFIAGGAGVNYNGPGISDGINRFGASGEWTNEEYQRRTGMPWTGLVDLGGDSPWAAHIPMSNMDRGTDTIHGMIHLSPGEQVDIHQPGDGISRYPYSMPSGISMPTSTSMPVGQSAAPASSTSMGDINFFLPNIGSKEEFTRSRAEIRRAIQSAVQPR